MSENSTPEERTEMPTERRLERLRKEGTLYHSTDIEQTISLMSGFLIVSIMAPLLLGDVQYIFRKAFEMVGQVEPLSPHNLQDGFVALLKLVGPHLFVVVAVVAATSSLAVMLQTGWNVREKKIKIQFSMLNPVNGVKRIFSVTGLMNVGKAILKLAIILPIGYFALQKFAPFMIQLIHMQLDQIFAFTASAMRTVFWKVVYVLIAIAIFDYVYGKFRWLQQNKMTKNEVKDERKAVEGDEETKRTIVLKGRARIQQRLRETVPTADVIITNPTHYSVALKYDRATMAAPVVVAKGRNFIALKIREIARERGIPVLERKPLARALYGSVEIGAVIPRELFKAVAEVLAYVYRLKSPYRQTQNSKR